MGLGSLEHIQNYIFDFDGTIVNSSKEVMTCLERTYQELGVEIIEERLTPDLIGPPLEEMVKTLIVDNINQSLIDEFASKFLEYYNSDENALSLMYDNVYDWLLSLKRADKRLFMATYKPTISAKRLVGQLKLNMFEEIYTIDMYDNKKISKTEMIDEIVRKNGLNKSETIMIGDAPSDIKAAHNSAIKAVGVLWGYGNHKQELIDISDFVLDLSDLKVLQEK